MRKFNNRQNRLVETTEGEQIWVSRAVAVVAEVCIYNLSDKRWYVLLGQRGEGTPDFQGYWGLPCGYLDWDEHLCEAVVREVWEECGLYLPGLSEQPEFIESNSSLTREGEFTDTPWSISDRLRSPTQNISMHYLVALSWKGEELPALSDAYCEPGEVSDLGWIDIEDAVKMDLAFNHNQRIERVLVEKRDVFELLERG